jgi:hypothetical protein
MHRGQLAGWSRGYGMNSNLNNFTVSFCFKHIIRLKESYQ